MATHPATPVHRYLAVVMANADLVHDASLGDRSSSLLGSELVCSNEEYARWFTLHTVYLSACHLSPLLLQ